MKKKRICKNTFEYHLRQVFGYLLIALLLLATFAVTSACFWITMVGITLIGSEIPAFGLVIVACTLGLGTTIYLTLHWAGIIS